MAKQEKAPIVPIPTIDKPKGLSRRAVVSGLAATGIVAGAGALSYVLTRPGEQSVTPPITVQPSVVPTELPTTAPTTPPTEKPTPTPTEKPLTDQEKIELARKARQEALAKGEFRLPVAQQVIDAGGRMDQGTLLSNGERDLFVILPPGKDIVFPALLDGKVIEAGKINPVINMISIQAEGKNINILTSSNSNIMVKKGDSVFLGTPLFSINYNPDSAQQKTFEERGAEVKPKGTVAVIAIQDANAGPGRGFQESTLEKTLLKDSNGKIITIPTLKANP